MELTIKDVVEGIGLPALKDLRTRLGISKGLTHKNELVEAVADHVDKNVRFVVRQLTPMEQKLVAEVAHNNGSYNLSVFRAKYQGWSPLTPSHASSKDSSLVWLFFKFYDGRCVMPPGLVAPLKGLLSKPAQTQISVQDEVPAEIQDKEFGSRSVRIHNGGEASLIELKKVLGLVSAGKLRVAPKSKRPTAGTEKKIQSILISEDFDLDLPKERAGPYKYAEPGGRVRSHSWAVLLQQCGWAKARGESLSLTEAGTRMMTRGRMEDFADGVEQLIDDDDFDELHRINHIRGQTGRAKRYMSRPSGRRFAIFQSMSGWPVEKWISVSEAYRLVRASGQDLETCRQPLYLYFGSFEYGHLSDGSGVDRQYLRVFLFESLGTLGLVDVAYTFPHFLWPDFGSGWGADDESYTGRYDGLLYVRLNRLGAYCLGLTDEFEVHPPERTGVFRVLPNHEIVLSGHEKLTPSVRHLLDSMASQASDLVWKIDRDVVLSYLESGGSAQELSELLDAYAVDGVPEQVRTFLADMNRKAQACRSSEEALLIELADMESAAEIANESRTSKFCRLVGTNEVVVRKRNLKAFQNALKKLGYVLPQ